jgi:transcriptional regulator GlxA family with amidase domain
MVCEALAAAHPKAFIEPDAIFVHDDPIWTSAGVTPRIDLALAMVEADHGRVLALRVARILVVFLMRSGGQSQFSAPLAAQLAEYPPVRSAQLPVIEKPVAAD